jgi:hypothetical protein
MRAALHAVGENRPEPVELRADLVRREPADLDLLAGHFDNLTSLRL